MADATPGSIQLFAAGSFPSLSTSCSSALSANISCPYLETGDEVYQIVANYTSETLSALCTTDCSDSIKQYRSTVLSVCGNETYSDGENSDLILKPIALPDYYFDNYFQRCLTDSDGNFCYVQFLTDKESALGCGECGLKMIQAQLSNAWSYDEDKAAAYSSLTSSCGVTNMPVTSPTPVVISSATAPAATPTCSGTTVTIKKGDTCDTIAEANSISTWSLLASNGLDGGCANFPTNGTLCIEGSCPTYVVSANETCSSIAKAHNITEVQLMSFNPQINGRCSNIDQAVGHHICVDSPYGPVASATGGGTTPAATTPATTTTEAPVPTNAADGSDRHCSKWYQILSGDYCASVAMKNNIVISDFYFLNPEINSNCTNLMVDISYCVQPVGDIATYSGYATATETGTSSVPTLAPTLTVSYGPEMDLDDLPTASEIVVAQPTQTGFPLANGTRADCSEYTNVANGPMSCEIFTFVHSVPLWSFVQWNPSLDYWNCVVQNETQYCSVLGTAFIYEVPQNHSYADVPSNAASNSTTECYFWWNVEDGDTCDSILRANDISIKYFYEWNPSVKDDCSGLWLDTAYCVMGPDWKNASYPYPSTSQAASNQTTSVTPTSTKATTTSSTATCSGSTITPTAATLSGIPCSCNKYAEREKGKYCYDIAQDNGISLDDFYKWNPGVGSDCQYLQDGYVYCVGVAS